jgi:predicted aldo/keto reductase-like oxidoreductase
VDQVDLLQLHNLADPDEWEVAMGPGGALEAAIEAREQGLLRFIGVTGHGLQIPAMHLRSLERFEFDSVLMPYNYAMMQSPQYRADFAAVEKVCQERNIALQTIKSIARGRWEDKEKNRETWYAPLEDQQSIERAVHYVLGHEGLFLNTVGDTILLEKVLDAASRFRAEPSQQEMEADLSGQEIAPLFTEDFSGP